MSVSYRNEVEVHDQLLANPQSSQVLDLMNSVILHLFSLERAVHIFTSRQVQ